MKMISIFVADQTTRLIMKLTENKLRQITSDLGLNVSFVRGQTVPIRNCWHFSTDGNAVEALFYDEEDFRTGMNRVYVVLKKYDVIILAFCLMDTHIHFVLYGKFEDCNRFIREYLRRTSMWLSGKYSKINSLVELPVSREPVTDDSYLKTVICYVVRNAPVGGIPFNPYDYPWCSGSLYFRCDGQWTSPAWETLVKSAPKLSDLTRDRRRDLLKSADVEFDDAPVIDGLIFPGHYVAYEIVEAVFKTCKSYLYFMSRTKETDVDEHRGAISSLSIPIVELRQRKRELCRELFGQNDLRNLDTSKRIRLAKALKSRYDSSPRQIVKMCGLVYDEVSSML